MANLMLKKGSKGPLVVELQSLLILHGFLEKGQADGDFGPKTEAAVLQFQAANDLKADGIVGPRTWAELRVAKRIDPFNSERPDLAALVNPTDTPAGIVLLFALNDLNATEKPPGSNRGPEIDHLVHNPVLSVREGKKQTYYDYIGLKSEAFPPWCMLAVSAWIGLGLGAEQWADEPGDAPAHPFPRWFGGVAQGEDWARKERRFTSRAKHSGPWPQGAIFTMGREGSGSDPSTSIRNGHTGLVLADDGDYVLTIEGNTSNAVLSKRRRKTDLRGFITWW